MVAAEGLEAARSRQEFRQLCYGLLRVLATKGGVLNVDALIIVGQIDLIDHSGSSKASGTLSLIRTGVRGGDISSAVRRGYNGSVKGLYVDLTSGKAIARLERIGIRTDYNEFTLSSMLKA